MKMNISFADLSHAGHFCNTTPYGVSLVAAYAIKRFGDHFEPRLFKKPERLIPYLDQAKPQLACFSNYIWNTNLSYMIAEQFKAHEPQRITVFGGPDYSTVPTEQEKYLLAHPAIDFYVFREGEQGFAALLETLFKYDFDLDRIRRERVPIPSTHYIADGKMVQGTLLPRMNTLDEIPSPYLTGLMDEFVSDHVPLMETTRGCPFHCSFCQDGHAYANNIRRYSQGRIVEELRYIAERTSSPNLMFADLNFGMYSQDLDVCREIAAIYKQYAWPKYFQGFTGKNKKERVLEGIEILRDTHSNMNAAVQSLDDEVLETIKRKNISYDQMIQIAKESEKHGTNSFAEVILCLPGDSKAAHLKSLCLLIDAGMHVVRSHQFIMLAASESAEGQSREKHGMVTRFRVVPNTAVPYDIYGRSVSAPEIDEICVANNTMSYADYVECRFFNLTIEIFYNNGIFRDLHKFLSFHDIKISSFIQSIHEKITKTSTPLSGVYEGFLRETNELWETRQEIDAFLKQPGTIEKYINGELGNNEQLVYRAIALFKHMDNIHGIAYGIAAEMLAQRDSYTEEHADYLNEMARFSLRCKAEIFKTDVNVEMPFRYDFVSLRKNNFDQYPLSYRRPDGLKIRISHTDEQREMIDNYLRIYGTSNYSLGHILSGGSDVNNLYRKAEVCDS